MNGLSAHGLGLALATLLLGCASGTGGKASGRADGAITCETDFSRLATTERMSLRDDVMPIFGLQCAMSSCHGSDTPAAKLYLGPRCVYDENSAHRCTFPDTPDGAGAMPLTADIVDRVYQDLLATSSTVANLSRVKPGDPNASFLIDKIGDTHNNRGYDCVSANSVDFGPCGAAMPFGTPGFCQFDTFGASSFNTIAAWVLQGAKNE